MAARVPVVAARAGAASLPVAVLLAVALLVVAGDARAGNPAEEQGGRVRLGLTVGTGVWGGSLDDPDAPSASPGGRYPTFLEVDPQIELGASFALSLAVRTTLEEGRTVQLDPGFVYHLWFNDVGLYAKLGPAVVVNPLLIGLREGLGFVWRFSDPVGLVLEAASDQFFAGDALNGTLWSFVFAGGLRGSF